ncbi:hypothetical protein GN956_G5204 [Arapaima gigas]
MQALRERTGLGQDSGAGGAVCPVGGSPQDLQRLRGPWTRERGSERESGLATDLLLFGPDGLKLWNNKRKLSCDWTPDTEHGGKETGRWGPYLTPNFNPFSLPALSLHLTAFASIDAPEGTKHRLPEDEQS